MDHLILLGHALSLTSVRTQELEVVAPARLNLFGLIPNGVFE